jgi:hypothetical protein
MKINCLCFWIAPHRRTGFIASISNGWASRVAHPAGVTRYRTQNLITASTRRRLQEINRSQAAPATLNSTDQDPGSVQILVDDEFLKWQHARIYSIELWASLHVFLVTEDERGHRIAHHFDYEGYKAEKFSPQFLQYRWLRHMVEDSKADKVLSAADIQAASLAAGHYKLFTNNCIHAAYRGLQSTAVVQGNVQAHVVFAIQTVVSVLGAIALSGSGVLIMCGVWMSRRVGATTRDTAAEKRAEEMLLDECLHTI